MQILMLAQFYPPIIGGEERHVRNLSRALVARGHSVAVVTHTVEGSPDYEDDQGVRIYRVGGLMQRLPGLFSEAGRRHAPPFPDPETALVLHRIIRREKPDIVHAHNWLIHSFLPLKRISHAKLVLTLHDYSHVCAKKRMLYHDQVCTGPTLRKCFGCALEQYGKAKTPVTVAGTWVMRRFKHLTVDMFLPVSHSVADQNGLTGTRLPYQVIPNFVPDDIGAPSNDIDVTDYVAKLPEGRFWLFVGDLSLDKGVDVLFRAYSGLKDAPPLVLIGRRWPETPDTLPPNAMILESWPHPAVMEAWRRSELGIAPSVCADACPTVVMEAMAAGSPVVGSRIGGLTELILDGKSGLLVEPNNADALRDALSRLLKDQALRERLAAVSSQRVVEFQAMTVVPRIEEVYQNLLNHRQLKNG